MVMHSASPELKLPKKSWKTIFCIKKSPKWLKISEDAQCVTSATSPLGSVIIREDACSQPYVYFLYSLNPSVGKTEPVSQFV